MSQRYSFILPPDYQTNWWMHPYECNAVRFWKIDKTSPGEFLATGCFARRSRKAVLVQRGAAAASIVMYVSGEETKEEVVSSFCQLQLFRPAIGMIEEKERKACRSAHDGKVQHRRCADQWHHLLSKQRHNKTSAITVIQLLSLFSCRLLIIHKFLCSSRTWWRCLLSEGSRKYSTLMQPDRQAEQDNTQVLIIMRWERLITWDDTRSAHTTTGKDDHHPCS